MEKIIQTKIKESDCEQLILASKLLGISRSSFIRMVALKEARKILIENKNEVSQK